MPVKIIQQKQLQHPTQSNQTYTLFIEKVGDAYMIAFKSNVGEKESSAYKNDKAVNLVTAEFVYQQAIDLKLSNGYIDMDGFDTKRHPKSIEHDARKKHILGYFNGEKDQSDKKWRIDRIIWRVGELRIKEAVPFIVKKANDGNDLFKYCVAWTLGRCEDESAVFVLQQYLDKSEKGSALNTISTAALLRCSVGEIRDDLVQSLLGGIPEKLQQLIEKGDRLAMRRSIREFLFARKKTPAFLVDLYLLADAYPSLQKPIAEVLEDVEIRPGIFKTLRQLYKLAEFRNDGLVFGQIAYHVEKTKQVFDSPSYGTNVWSNGKRFPNYKNELKKSNSKLAFSDKTKQYLTKRTWRTLRKLGEESSSDYVKMATGVLLPYDDSLGLSRVSKSEEWVYNRGTQRYHKVVKHFDTGAENITFNHILYGNSPRYKLPKSGKAWVCSDNYEPSKPSPKEREESYPELWDKMPKALIHLMAESDSKRVQEFAVKAFRENPQYDALLEKIDKNLIIRFLGRPFDVTNNLGLELAKKIYDPQNPDKALVAALLNSKLEEARKIALAWMKEQQKLFLSDTAFVVEMILNQHADMREWIEGVLPDLDFDKNQQKIIIGKVLSSILGITISDANNAIVKNAGSAILKAYSASLSRININIVQDLLNHELSECKVLAGKLLVNHQMNAEDVPEELIQTLLDSEKDTVRHIGIELFAQFSDDTLLQRYEQLVSFVTSSLADVRLLVRPIITRLSEKYDDFATKISSQIASVLLRKEPHEGLHKDMYSLLSTELESHLHSIDRKLIFRLLNSKQQIAQIMGVDLVKKYVSPESLSVRNIIRLSGHEMLEARQTAWKMFDEGVGRMRYEREEAIRLLDSDWDDTRAFALGFFRTKFKKGDWTPELLVGICDSVRTDVQDFGKELISQFFDPENGAEYLLKLSEHPTTKLQVFASEYLDDFAKGNLVNLKKLELYFVTVLSRVNKGRTAKDRVLALLEHEGLQTHISASFVTNILNRISATQAIEDKARCIEILRNIQVKYPQIETAIDIQEFPVV